jgi:hypothetical protein
MCNYGDWRDWERRIFIYISLIRSEFSAYLGACRCASTLWKGVRVASRREAHLRLNINPQFATILLKLY